MSQPFSAKPAHLPDGYAFYKKIGSPKFICAPMVEQSELPFRLLCRSYNIPLCYSPMIHSKMFITHPRYSESVFQTCSEDHPLIAQFCANDPDVLLSAAKLIQHKVDAIDLNFGCPQRIAKRGNYGAFLLKDVDLMCTLVNTLVTNLSIPICAKIRIVSDETQTLEICQRLRESGISLLTVHGRTVKCKKGKIGPCNFGIIKKIKASLDIPVFANGGCEDMNDVMNCLKITNCDGYMAAESILSDPSIFYGKLDVFKISRDYIAFCKRLYYSKKWISRNKYIAVKKHLLKILYRELTIFQDIRNSLGGTDDLQWIWNVVDLLEMRRKNMNKFLYQFIYDKVTVNYYHRHWKSYKQIKAMDIWEIIWNECTKPIEKNESELIGLLVQYKVLNYDECKAKLMLSARQIINLKIVEMQKQKEEIRRNENMNRESEANLINSMFGMHQDSDDEDLDS